MRLKYRSVPAPYSGSVESSKTEKIGRKKSKEHYLCQTFCISNCIVNVRAWAHSHVATDASLILKFETIEHMCPSTLCVWLFQRMIVWFATNEQLYYFVCFFFTSSTWHSALNITLFIFQLGHSLRVPYIFLIFAVSAYCVRIFRLKIHYICWRFSCVHVCVCAMRSLC